MTGRELGVKVGTSFKDMGRNWTVSSVKIRKVGDFAPGQKQCGDRSKGRYKIVHMASDMRPALVELSSNTPREPTVKGGAFFSSKTTVSLPAKRKHDDIYDVGPPAPVKLEQCSTSLQSKDDVDYLRLDSVRWDAATRVAIRLLQDHRFVHELKRVAVVGASDAELGMEYGLHVAETLSKPIKRLVSKPRVQTATAAPLPPPPPKRQPRVSPVRDSQDMTTLLDTPRCLRRRHDLPMASFDERLGSAMRKHGRGGNGSAVVATAPTATPISPFVHTSRTEVLSPLTPLKSLQRAFLDWENDEESLV